MKEQIEKMAAQLAELYPRDFISITTEYSGIGNCLSWRFRAVAMPRENTNYDFQAGASTLPGIDEAIADIQTIDMRLNEVLKSVSEVRTIA